MSHAARSYASWISALVFVAITSSCVTWLSVQRNKVAHSEHCSEFKPRRGIINGTFLDKLLRDYQNVSRKAHGLFKVYKPKNSSLAGTEEINIGENAEDHEKDRLVWAEEFHASNIVLNSSNKWISVKERGVYLIYLQVTFDLNLINDSVDLELIVDFAWNDNGIQEFAAVYDTRKHTKKNEEAHLSTFLLLHMNAQDRLAVRANPNDKIQYTDTRPITSYITIVKYAD
ncbi:hypothetical protein AMEX_G297 [Astyanax mexicanus]|uniref:THD domain-containing protein n=1 Tax=Astyanax mexicanus TaxID=7994 RepID=A0A8T2MIB6_ASTMX|nr:hypothetical protein AMEX_G297 [Astyanax mexicanus]